MKNGGGIKNIFDPQRPNFIRAGSISTPLLPQISFLSVNQPLENAQLQSILTFKFVNIQSLNDLCMIILLVIFGGIGVFLMMVS